MIGAAEGGGMTPGPLLLILERIVPPALLISIRIVLPIRLSCLILFLPWGRRDADGEEEEEGEC